MQLEKHQIKLVIIGLLFFSLFHFCYSFSVINDSHNWGGDFALYISQAKAIVNGNSNTLYEASKASCEGSYERMNPDVYPVVFPLMLTPIYLLFGINFLAFKIVIICCFLITLASVCFFVYKKLGVWEAIIIVGLLATSIFFIKFNNYVLADTPAMMWVWISLLVYLFFKESTIKLKLIKFSVLGLFVAIAFQTKTLSISVFVAVLLSELFLYFKRQNALKEFLLKTCAFIAVFVVVFIIIYGVYPSSGGGYFKQLSKLTIPILKNNLVYYANAPNWFLYNSTFFVWFTFPAAVFGVFYRFKQNLFLVILFGVHLLLLILWPFQEGLRFLLFLVPLYFYFACIGYSAWFLFFVKKNKFSKLFSLRYIVLVVIIGYSLINAWRLHAELSNSDNEITSKEAIELFEFVNTQTKPSDKFIFFKPNVLRLICNRESVYILNTNAVLASKANYWIYKKGDKMADTATLNRVLMNNEFIVFKLK